MKTIKSAAGYCLNYLVFWLCLHGLHWLAVHLFGSVLPPAFSPATWIGDGIDAFFGIAALAFHEQTHRDAEKRQTQKAAARQKTMP